MRYEPNEEGVQALNKMSAALVDASSKIIDAGIFVENIANENSQALGPHITSLKSAIGEIKSTLNDTTEPVDAISARLGKVAKGYRRLINNNRFAKLGGAAAAAGVSSQAGGRNSVENSTRPTRRSRSSSSNSGESKTVITDGSHIDEDGNLKPNIRYKTGEYDYIYETDSQGRIIGWVTNNLQLTKRAERLPHDKNTPGKIDGDHAGHLAGDRFGGSPHIDNLVSQSSYVNLSEYKILENEWARAIANGKEVETSVVIKYNGDDLRPSGFAITYMIDGYLENCYIENGET